MKDDPPELTSARADLVPNAILAWDLGRGLRDVWRVPSDLTVLDVGRDGRVLVAANILRNTSYWHGPGDARERDVTRFSFATVASARDLSTDGRALLFTNAGAGAEYEVGLRTPPVSPAPSPGRCSSRRTDAPSPAPSTGFCRSCIWWRASDDVAAAPLRQPGTPNASPDAGRARRATTVSLTANRCAVAVRRPSCATIRLAVPVDPPGSVSARVTASTIEAALLDTRDEPNVNVNVCIIHKRGREPGHDGTPATDGNRVPCARRGPCAAWWLDWD